MKKRIFFISVFGLILSQSFAQQNYKQLKEEAVYSFQTYLFDEMKIDYSVFFEYFEFDDRKSRLFLNTTFNSLEADSFYMDDILGFLIVYKLRDNKKTFKNHADLRIELYINEDFEVDYSKVWNSKIFAATVGNVQLRYSTFPEEYKKIEINSVLEYVYKLKNNQVVSLEEINDFLKKEYPQNEWREINLIQEGSPPYPVIIVANEESCDPCLELRLSVDELKVLSQKSKDVNYIKY